MHLFLGEVSPEHKRKNFFSETSHVDELVFMLIAAGQDCAKLPTGWLKVEAKALANRISGKEKHVNAALNRLLANRRIKVLPNAFAWLVQVAEGK